MDFHKYSEITKWQAAAPGVGIFQILRIQHSRRRDDVSWEIQLKLDSDSEFRLINGYKVRGISEEQTAEFAQQAAEMLDTTNSSLNGFVPCILFCEEYNGRFLKAKNPDSN